MKNRNTGKALLSQIAVILFAALLLMCAVTSVRAEQAGATDDPYHFGLNEEEDPNAGKATGTPKPTEFPFEPGIREDHTGHKTHNTVLEITDYMHRIREYCDDCQMKIRVYWEDHQLDAEGHCLKCSYRCKHDHTYVREVPADGGEKTWDGNWISYPGTEITVCYRCNKYLKYENTVIRKFHNRHTRFLPEQECLPHDADTHALVRVCEDCGTEVIKYVPHNCPPSDRPYTDDGDSDTHSRLVRCADCGFWVPQQQAHTWVHDSYMKDETLGTDTGHIEVFRCDVCGAKKYEKQPHDAGKHVAYKANGDIENHTEVLRCGLCGQQFEADCPHELVFDSNKHDGDLSGHLDIYKCTVCGQTVETRVPHSPKHVIWKSVSDTQDQEVVYCAICGTTYALAPAAHQFDSFAYDSNGLDNHTVCRACSKCGEREKNGKTYTEGHSFSGAACSKCNQSARHEGDHLFTFDIVMGYTLLDDESHAPIWRCFDPRCHALFTDYSRIQQHTYDPVTMKCTACGFLKEGCEHHYEQVIYHTKDGHFFGGKCVKCGKQIAKPFAENHKMQSEGQYCLQHSENGHIAAELQKCTVCGYRSVNYSEESAHVYVQVGDELRCKECGHLKQSTCEHSFVCTLNPGKQTVNTHYYQLKCSKCGAEAFKVEEHDLKLISASEWKKVSDNDHIRTAHYQCSVCGYEKDVTESGSHEYDISYRYTYYNFDKHRKITVNKCKECGFTVEDSKIEWHDFQVDSHGEICCTMCGRYKSIQ